MADPTDPQALQPADPYDPAALQRILSLITPPRPQMPDSGQGRSVVGLLGDALSGGGAGGTAGLSDDQYNQAGRSALLDAGVSMLRASNGYQAAPRSFLDILGGGIQAAQRGETQSEAISAARQADMLDQWQDEKKTRLAALGQVGKMQELQLALRRLQVQQGWPLPGDPTGAPGSVANGNAPVGAAPGGGDPVSFVRTYLPQAQKVAAATGIPVETVLAQAGNESGWGGRMPSNNFFGIGVTGGKTPGYDTPEAGFGAYASLVGSDRYKNVPRDKGPQAFGDGLAQAGYNALTPGSEKTNGPSYGSRIAGAQATVERILGSGGAGAPPGTPTAAATPPTLDAGSGPAGAQSAGPGAVAGPVAPPGPAVAGDVGAITAGMTGAGANASTLAPGAAPPGPPGTQVAGPPATAPAPGPPPPAKGSPEEYALQHPLAPPPPEIANPNLDPATVKHYTDMMQAARNSAAAARGDPNGAKDYVAANKQFEEAKQALATAQIAAAKDATDRVASWNKDRLAERQANYAAVVTQRNTDANRGADVSAAVDKDTLTKMATSPPARGWCPTLCRS